MAYIPATVEDVKRRYPAFDPVPDTTVALWLADAAQDCAAWPDDYRTRGEVLRTAHSLAELGLGAGAIPAGVSSFKSGTFSATVSDNIAGATGFASTVYGREFLSLQRKLFGGPIMAWQADTYVS